jgi:hypothetical protein
MVYCSQEDVAKDSIPVQFNSIQFNSILFTQFNSIQFYFYSLNSIQFNFIHSIQFNSILFTQLRPLDRAKGDTIHEPTSMIVTQQPDSTDDSTVIINGFITGFSPAQLSEGLWDI